MVDALEEFYQETNIYKALLITQDDEETRYFAEQLDQKNHSVVSLDEERIDDERFEVFLMDKFRHFQQSARIFVVSSSLWYRFKDLFELYVLPQQNLIAFGRVEEGLIRFMMNAVMESAQRGFVEDISKIHVLRLPV